MKERPILFSGPMVRAILEGWKTQTRRIVKPQPEGNLVPELVQVEGEPFPRLAHGRVLTRKGCPYGQPGDRLWVRETWQGFRQTSIEYDEWEEMESPKDRHDDFYHPVYKADGKNFPDKWQPSIHMPREYSRIDLEITGVRVERLQDISEADIHGEGAITDEWLDWREDVAAIGMPSGSRIESEREVWQNLWSSINGPESWDANPWVWVVEFKRVSRGDA